MTSSWYSTFKSAVEQIYELLNDEGTIGDTISEFAYTMQTGYPRYIINNFSINDLEKFLDHPQIESFFILVRETAEGGLEYGLVYKHHDREDNWRVSTIKHQKYFVSTSLSEYVTGKADFQEEDYAPPPRDNTPTILTDDDDELFDRIKEQSFLLLRPKTGSFSNNKTRKLISWYEEKIEAPEDLSSERYIFQLLLTEPEYLDSAKFKFICEKIHKVLQGGVSPESAKLCKQISVLFEDTFQAYRVGLLL